MDERHRKILQKRSLELADIIPTEQLFAALYQRKVFDAAMIETIKAEKTQSDQMGKLLTMLPKRGPHAFYSFVEVLGENYDWLAKMLKQDDTSDPDGLLQQANNNIQADTDIKMKINTFLHKQFGNSKKISQQDKKSMERWLTEQLQAERNIKAGIKSKDDNLKVDETCTNFISHSLCSNLEKLHQKLKDINIKHKWKSEPHKKQSDDDQNSNRLGIAKANAMPVECIHIINKLENKIETLIGETREVENYLRECHEILNDPDMKHDLLKLINAQITNTSKMQEMEKEIQILLKQQETDKNLYDDKVAELCKHNKSTSKLDITTQLRNQNEKLSKEIGSLNQTTVILNKKCKDLEETNLKHLEKEKTIQDLKNLIEVLKNKSSSIIDENANYRLDIVPPKKSRRPTNRNGSLLEPIITTKKSPRKSNPKSFPSTTKRKKPKDFNDHML